MLILTRIIYTCFPGRANPGPSLISMYAGALTPACQGRIV